jgi:hypothetical protein
MLEFLSSVLCISKVHLFSLGNYLETLYIVGNLIKNGVTSVEWLWLGLESPPAYYVVLYS